jgi:hypothetical protein
LHARQHANLPDSLWFHVSCAQTTDLIDTTAADCTLPDQHAAGEGGAAKFCNAAGSASQRE